MILHGDGKGHRERMHWPYRVTQSYPRFFFTDIYYYVLYSSIPSWVYSSQEPPKFPFPSCSTVVELNSLYKSGSHQDVCFLIAGRLLFISVASPHHFALVFLSCLSVPLFQLSSASSASSTALLSPPTERACSLYILYLLLQASALLLH